MATPDTESEYNNTHRALLQALFARPHLTFNEAGPILAAIKTASDPDRPTAEGDITRDDVEDAFSLISTHVSPFDFEIRSTRHQTTKERVYALVNTTSDALTQMATLHSADEIAFVKRVIDDMFETYNTERAEVMAVTSMQAMKLAKGPSEGSRRETQGATQGAAVGLTMSKAEEMLACMVGEGWFELSQKGFYTLSPGALMELRGWLTETYNDDGSDDEDEETRQRIKTCQGCKEIVTVGQRCPKLRCLARMHTHCVGNTLKAEGRNRCPLCKTAWVDALSVGEKAARGARGSNMSGGRRSSGPSNGRAAAAAAEESSDEAESGAGE